MVELETLEHKLKKDPFWPHYKIFFGFGANKYDSGYKMAEKQPDPPADLDQVFATVEQGIKDL